MTRLASDDLVISENESINSALNRIDRLFLESDIDSICIAASPETTKRLREFKPSFMKEERLTRASWNKATGFFLPVDDLLIRPVEDREIDGFVRLLKDEQIARMLVNLNHPIEETAAMRWIKQRRFSGRPGFQLGVFRDSHLVGSIGISALSNALVYFMDRDARGKGYAMKIMAPFVEYTIARWRMPEIFAGVFYDNPASRHILERSGFVVRGSGMIKSPARAEPAPFWEMTYTQRLG